MRFLCIDTSDKPLYAAVYSEGRINYRYDKDCGMQHSKTLISAVDALLKDSGLALNDMDCFCAVTGPGSFTGIRIGITTIRAFCQVCGRPALGVNSLELKAYNIGINGKIAVPLIDAMQGRVYYAAYDKGNEIISPSVCKFGELDEEINSRLKSLREEKEILYVFEKDIPGIKSIISPTPVPQLTEICAEKMAAGKTAHYENLAPLYAALCQAEISYADQHKKVE